MTFEEALISKRFNHHHSIEINGVTGNLTYWSKIYGFSHSIACSQLKKGRTIESIIEGSKKKREELENKIPCRVIEFNGLKKQIKEWAEELNIPILRIINRYKTGLPPEYCLYGGDLKQCKKYSKYLSTIRPKKNY